MNYVCHESMHVLWFCPQGHCGRCPPGFGVMADLVFFFFFSLSLNPTQLLSAQASMETVLGVAVLLLPVFGSTCMWAVVICSKYNPFQQSFPFM